ncbi:MAG: hypothetical protein IK037_03750, partial [Clostridia bacterium]|nr:hypothetical protein [Clostridia bacterium]
MSKRSKLTMHLVFAATAVLFLALLAFSMGLSAGATAFAAEPEQTYNIYTVADFVGYARAYAAGDRNPKDVLNISINSGSEITDDTFISLGTAARPFAGTIDIHINTVITITNRIVPARSVFEDTAVAICHTGRQE